MYTLKVKATLIDSMLGTAPADKEIYSTYIASKSPDAKTREEEIEMIGKTEYEEKQMTVFRRDNDGNVVIPAYMVKGFFKNAGRALNFKEKNGTKTSSVKAFIKEIDNRVFVSPDYIKLDFEGDITICQRPLRAQTPQGERVSLASAEQVPAGTTLEFEVTCFTSDGLELVREWLDYGRFNGIGQWHNSGKGRFTWEEIK